MNYHESEVPYEGPEKKYQMTGDVTLFPNGLARIGNRTFPDRAMIEGYEFAPGCRVDRKAGSRLICIKTADGEEYRFRYAAMRAKWYRETPVAPTLDEQAAKEPARLNLPWHWQFGLNGDLMVFLRRWGWAIFWLFACTFSILSS